MGDGSSRIGWVIAALAAVLLAGPFGAAIVLTAVITPAVAEQQRLDCATTVAASGPWRPPFQQAFVRTSVFGMRFHPILHVWKLHSGTDFGIPCGTPVYATAAGTVLSAGWGGGYGNRITIDHGIQRGVDLVTTYNHLSSILVHSGDVRRGQLIGYAGTTGYSTGCHLHFETLEDGSFVNPRTWI